MGQALFLIGVLGGAGSLIAAIAVARLHWQADIAPFGRRPNSLKVLARPASYAERLAFLTMSKTSATQPSLAPLVTLLMVRETRKCLLRGTAAPHAGERRRHGSPNAPSGQCACDARHWVTAASVWFTWSSGAMLV